MHQSPAVNLHRRSLARIEEILAMAPMLRFGLLLFLGIILPVAAQSPNTATMIVVVEDQTCEVLKDAVVSVLNSATGAARETVSGTDGKATMAALPLTGTYTVSVSKPGFGSEQL